MLQKRASYRQDARFFARWAGRNKKTRGVAAVVYRHERRAAGYIAAAVWAVTGFAALFIPGRLWLRAAVVGGAAAIGWLWAWAVLGAARWGVRQNAFFAQSGLLFFHESRLALKDITAVQQLRLPFGGRAGCLLLAAWGPGGQIAVYGVRTADANAFVTAWQAAQ